MSSNVRIAFEERIETLPVSHLLPLNVIVNNCVFYSEAPVPGCNANWGPPTLAAPARHATRIRPQAQPAPPGAPAAPPAQPPARAPALHIPRLPHVPLPVGPSGAPSQDTVKRLLDYLLR